MSYVWTDIAIFKCPGCDKRVRIDGVQPFHKRLRKPEPFHCPECGQAVTWAKTPIQIVRAGQWLLLLGFVPILVNGFASWSILIFGVAGVAMGIGMLTQRLIECEATHRATEHEKDAQRSPSA